MAWTPLPGLFQSKHAPRRKRRPFRKPCFRVVPALEALERRETTNVLVNPVSGAVLTALAGAAVAGGVEAGRAGAAARYEAGSIALLGPKARAAAAPPAAPPALPSPVGGPGSRPAAPAKAESADPSLFGRVDLFADPFGQGDPTPDGGGSAPGGLNVGAAGGTAAAPPFADTSGGVGGAPAAPVGMPGFGPAAGADAASDQALFLSPFSQQSVAPAPTPAAAPAPAPAAAPGSSPLAAPLTPISSSGSPAAQAPAAAPAASKPAGLAPIIAVGSDAGGPPVVKVFDATTGAEKFQFLAYDASFTGGVRVASADLTGDGVPDIITAPGPGMAPEVKVFDGTTGAQLTGPVGDFLAYDSSFTGGVFVAAGDVNGDGTNDIIVGPGAGGGSTIKTFSGKDASLVSAFDAFGPGYEAGVPVAVGYWKGASHADVVAGTGPGVPAEVKTLDALTGAPMAGPAGDLHPYGDDFRGGVWVAAGDLNGGATPDIITGAGAGHAPEVKAFSGADGSVLDDFLAGDPSDRTGVRVASTYIDGSTDADIVTAGGPGDAPQVNVYSGATGQLLPPPEGGFLAFDKSQRDGLFVAAAIDPWVTVTITQDVQTVLMGKAVQVTVNWNSDVPNGQVRAQSNIGWGDGTADILGDVGGPSGTVSRSHTYVDGGVYQLVVFIGVDGPDGGGASATALGKITVDGPPPSIPATASVPPGADTNCGCPNHSGSLARDAAGAAPPVPDGFSSPPVRYIDGVADLAQTDLHSDASSMPWGQTRAWTNGQDYAAASQNGNGWVDTQLPHLLSVGTSVAVVTNGTTAHYFDLVYSGYQPRFFDQSTLTDAGGQFVLTDSAGDQLRFDDFSSGVPLPQQGQFVSFTDPYGNVTAVTALAADGQIDEVQRTTTAGGASVTESYLYSYIAPGLNGGLLQSETLRRQVNGGAWTTVRQALYTYYNGTDSTAFTLGDLEFAQVLDGSGDVLATSYYRYYTSSDDPNIAYVDGLKYALGPQSYARATAALGDPASATDAQLAPYADEHFEYGSGVGYGSGSGSGSAPPYYPLHPVTKEVAQGEGSSTDAGGLGTFTYYYTESNNAAGFNSWAAKTAETLPDGSTDTVYTNAYGEVMLSAYHDTTTGLTYDSAYRYDGQGRPILAAAPSAVNGYSDSYADLLNFQNGVSPYLNNASGVITLYDYYGATTATETTAGGVLGYQQDVKLEQGQQGAPILQEAWQYFQHTATSDGAVIAPLATDTVYHNTDGTGAETTSYAYVWVPGTAGPQSVTVTAPVISAAENGPGTADVTTTVFDAYGNPIWTQDGDGFLDYFAYDAATGAVVTSIIDVNTADRGEFTNLPTGWSTPAGGGLNLITTDVVDALGRTTEETSPGGNVAYFVYLDPQQEERVYNGWNAATGTPTGPTAVYREDLSDSYTETLTMTAAPHLTNGAPDGTEAIGGLQTLSRSYVNAAGQLATVDSYFNLSGLTYTTAVMGAVGVNFYQTQYGYDDDGRPSRTQTGNGTIYRTVYDGLGRAVSDWVGTNDTPASGEWSPTNNTGTSNMVQLAAYVYDGGGVGDGNLTQETDYPGGTAAARVTQLWYDWRDRVVASKSGVQATENDGTNRPILVTTYDNLDEVTETQQYTGDGVTPQIVGGVLQPLSASLLRAQEVDSYDEQGRVYQTQVYDVNPTTGAVSTTALTTNDYYDHRGDLIAVSAPGGLWSKSQFDGAGRDVTDYATDGAGGTSWAAAGSVANDTVLEQTQTVYDGDSNVVETIDRQRFHNATGLGPLGNPTSGVGARVYYAAAYYDNADRLTATVDVGTNGGAAWTRPATPPAPSDTALVTTYGYNPAGWVQDVTDPRGIDTRTLYDALGRTTKTIQDYTGAAEGAENDVATEYGYDGDGNVLYVQADEPNGAYQKTAYVYAATTAAGDGVNSNDILTAVQHPDPTTGNPSSTQQDTYLLNALGETTQATDRNGNVHQLTYDVLGRVTSDAVTTLGAGVDGAVRRIDTAYDSQGNAYLVTSYDAATGGNVVNQVLRQFNGLGQLTAEFQSHSGAVNVNTTPAVLYAYTELSGGQNNSRPVSMTYPSGYVVNYNYGAGLDSSISRLTSLSDSGGTLESYKYLGLATVVERDHPQNNVNLTYISQNGSTGDAGDPYTGLDRFGRVAEQNWYNAGTHASTDDFKYGYDRDGNVLSRTNVLDSIFSEGYGYDNLNQLTSFTRGTHTQGWAPDALGNFTSVVTDGTTQTRTANQQNEITSISGAGAVTYDANGNTTADGSGNTFVYDAWNRLVAVKNGGNTLASYGYNGLGERVTETHGTTTTDLYLSAAGQVLEERVGGVAQTRYVWSPVYVNGLVLRDQSGQRLYAQQDANWNVTALVDVSGNVQERDLTDAYGVVTVLTPGWASRGVSAYGWLYLDQGERYDPATGLYNFNGRVWSPTLMRFVQVDPLGLAPDNNDYRGEGDNPINATDPSGLTAKYIEGGQEMTATGGQVKSLDLSGLPDDAYLRKLGLADITSAMSFDALVRDNMVQIIDSQDTYSFDSLTQFTNLAKYRAWVVVFAKKLQSLKPAFSSGETIAAFKDSKLWQTDPSVTIVKKKVDYKVTGLSLGNGTTPADGIREFFGDNAAKASFDCATFQSLVSRRALLEVLGEQAYNTKYKDVSVAGLMVKNDPFPFGVGPSRNLPGMAVQIGFPADQVVPHPHYHDENTIYIGNKLLIGHPFSEPLIGVQMKEKVEEGAGATGAAIKLITDIPFKDLPK